MKKLFSISKLAILALVFLLPSCQREYKQKDKKKLDYFVEHSYSVNGRTIKFSLPKWYTDKNVEDKRYLPQHVRSTDIRFSEFIYFSTKNDNNYFLLYIRHDGLDSHLNKYPDNVLDSFITSSMRAYKYNPGITFNEKKWDVNNHPYYNLIYLGRYYHWMDYRDPINKLVESDSIESKFAYITYFGMTGYAFLLSSIEGIDEFSYEEKRQVLESISIE